MIGKQQRWIWLLGLCILILSLGLGSCNPRSLPSQSEQRSRVVDSVTSDPKTFNYPLNQSSPNVFGLIYDGLVGSDGLTGELEPALAESWEISDDQTEITFTLRDNLRWSDGEPLTVDDVLFTYNDIYFNENIPTDQQDILRIGDDRVLPTVEQVGDRQIRVTTPEPFAPLLRNMGFPVLPKHALEEAVNTLDADGNPRFITMWGTDTDPKLVVGNGSYTLDRYVTSQRVVFKKNPYYWRQDEAGNSQPYLDEFVWQIVENKNTQLLKFRSGDLDISEPMRPEDFALLKREEQRGDFSIYVGGPRPGTVFFGFNLNKGSRNGQPLVDPIKSRWFNTLEFRQAVAYAIDRQAMINTVFRGLGELINSPITIQSPYYLSPQEGLPVYNYDLDQARSLLEEAGFSYNGNDQLVDWDGNPVRFTLLTNAGNTIREAMGARIVQDLSQIGIQVDFQPIAFNTFVDKLNNTLDWECHLIGFTGGVEPNAGSAIWQPDGGLHTFNQKPLPVKTWVWPYSSLRLVSSSSWAARM
ncbi:MAG: ABC transporter substrate-binding protein [Cyanobacteria bacterium P01_H01_bin.121]